MKKLVLIDFMNQLYSIVFTIGTKHYNLEKDSNIREDVLERCFRDCLEEVYKRMFNIILMDNKYKVEIIYFKDGVGTWRKKRIYDLYKYNRNKDRGESKYDFKLIFEIFNKIWDVLKYSIPYKCILVDGIETDDFIYQSIIKYYKDYDKFKVISKDTDFYQLLKHKKVELYHPINGIVSLKEDVNWELFFKVIKGDNTDNIPSIYSDERGKAEGKVFKKTFKKIYDDGKFKEWINSQSDKIRKRYIRNQKLINFKYIPNDIIDIMNNELDKPKPEFSMSRLVEVSSKYDINILLEKMELLG